MSESGASELYVRARRALLDAVEALQEHLDALVLVGAQAIYLHTGVADVAIATYTKDSDVVVDPSVLGPEPLLEEAMRSAGFELRQDQAQPGEWVSRSGMPVDLLVPEAVGGAGKRAARIRPHDKSSARKVIGLEAALVDNARQQIHSLEPSVDERTFRLKVAGPTALLIAKLHKIGERQAQPSRLDNKDAHDIYRLLLAADTSVFSSTVPLLLQDDLAAPVTNTAVRYLEELFADPTSLGSTMAGAAERGVGRSAQVAAGASALARDLLDALST